tara:strand:+ start:242 stop:652 length:411 start_codon:yes stop_codon:yes gene_type:complete
MIVGIGLPRTGTRSLGAALDILGYKGSHFCELIGTTKAAQKEDSYRIDNSLYYQLKTLNKNDIYIMTYRPPEDWRGSIFQFKDYTGPDIETYRDECIKRFNESKVKFLIFNIIEGWDPLCKFLDLPIPKREFPIIT